MKILQINPTVRIVLLIVLVVLVGLAVKTYLAPHSEWSTTIKRLILGLLLVGGGWALLVTLLLLVMRRVLSNLKDEAEWRRRLESALGKQEGIAAQSAGKADFLELKAVKGLDYEAWLKSFQ